MHDRSKYLFATIAFLVAGGLLGWVLASNFSQNRPGEQIYGGVVSGIGGGPGAVSVSASKVSNFQEQVQALFRQHVVVTGQYLKNLIDARDTSSQKAAVDKNSAAVADMLGGVYGSNYTGQFRSMWDEHVREYENYATAARNGDDDAKKVAQANLNSMADNFQNMINALNQDTEASKLGDLMREHMAGTLLLIEAYIARNQPQVTQLEASNYDQAGRLADYIVEIVTSARPERFR